MARFLIGLAIGLLVGVAAVILVGPRARKRGASNLIDGALDAARHASDVRQQEMWADYRARIQKATQPRAKESAPAWESHER